MHLSDRGGSDGFILEFGKDLFDLLTCLHLDHSAGNSRIQFLHILSELLEFLAKTLREYIHTAGHDLADLDVSRTQVLQCCPELYRCDAVRVEIMLGQHREHLRGALFFLLALFLDILMEELFQLRSHLQRRMLESRLHFLQFPLHIVLAAGGRFRTLILFFCLSFYPGSSLYRLINGLQFFF